MFTAWNEVLKWIFTGKSVVLLEWMISLLWYSTFLPPSSALRHIPLNLPPSSVPSTSVLPSPTTTPSLLPSPPPPPFPSHLSDPSSLLFPVYLSSFISLSLLSSLSLFFHLFILFPLSFSPLSSLFFLSSLCALSSLSSTLFSYSASPFCISPLWLPSSLLTSPPLFLPALYPIHFWRLTKAKYRRRELLHIQNSHFYLINFHMRSISLT